MSWQFPAHMTSLPWYCLFNCTSPASFIPGQAPPYQTQSNTSVTYPFCGFQGRAEGDPPTKESRNAGSQSTQRIPTPLTLRISPKPNSTCILHHRQLLSAKRWKHCAPKNPPSSHQKTQNMAHTHPHSPLHRVPEHNNELGFRLKGMDEVLGQERRLTVCAVVIEEGPGIVIPHCRGAGLSCKQTQSRCWAIEYELPL